MTEIKSPAQEDPSINNTEERKQSSNRRKYISVNYKTRKELLRIISEENLTIKTAAERLQINYSNAKNIVKVYKKEHRIEKLLKKPNLTLKEITSPFYTRGAIPVKAALFPFYDVQEAQKFLSWTKDKKKMQEMERRQQTSSNQSTRAGMDHLAKLPTGEKEGPTFSFEAYRFLIPRRFSYP
eukprot:TRINITY_DN14645_c0_g2_i10.p1 TRINITY_DN14645_c0_g2~~TRINITY_DN14645_c0_g2_i10.p1  ORF type:complete len:182 (-),score=37.00 TRINITY_DN14645_c0_g2_i10:260-805(-)